MVGVVVGLAIVLGAIWTGWWPLGIVGFAVMVAGGFWAMSSSGSQASGSTGDSTGTARKPGSGGQRGPGFMDRMEDRWDKRRGGQ